MKFNLTNFFNKIINNNSKIDNYQVEEENYVISEEMIKALSTSMKEIQVYRLREAKQKLINVRNGIVKFTTLPEQDIEYYKLAALYPDTSSKKTKSYVCKK